EVERVLAERFVERGAALDIGLDVEDELLHGGFLMPVADDLERLHERDARGEHCGQLAAEYRDVAGGGFATRVDLALPADARRRSPPPSLAACPPISGALPKARMMRTIASVTGNT